MRKEIHLRPWKDLTLRNTLYIYNVERILSSKVDQETIHLLNALQQDPQTPITDDQEMLLLQLELISTPDDDQHLYRFDEKNAARVSPIRGMTLMVSQRCNSRCLYCYGIDGSYDHEGMMDEKTAFAALDWLILQQLINGVTAVESSNSAQKDRDPLSIGFFGGEPLLNFPLLQKAVHYANAKASEIGSRIEFTISTNCTLLDETIISFLQEHRFDILLSIDGPPDIHDRNRPLKNGRSSYSKAVPEIRSLMEALPERKLTLHSILWESGDLVRVLPHLSSFEGVKYNVGYASPSLLYSGGTSTNPPHVCEFEDMLFQYADTFLQGVHEKNVSRIKDLLLWEDFFEIIRIIGHRKRCGIACGVGRSGMAVSIDGCLYPCHRFVGAEAHVIGSIFESKNLDNRLSYRNSVVDQFCREPCSICWAHQICIGGCVYQHIARTGNISTPNEIDCGLTQARLRAAIYIENELSHEERLFLHQQKVVPKRPCLLDM